MFQQVTHHFGGACGSAKVLSMKPDGLAVDEKNTFKQCFHGFITELVNLMDFELKPKLDRFQTVSIICASATTVGVVPKHKFFLAALAGCRPQPIDMCP